MKAQQPKKERLRIDYKSSRFMLFLVIVSFFTSCKKKDSEQLIKSDKENDSVRRIEEFVNIKGSSQYLNQVIFYDENNKIDNASQYYELTNNNCIRYHSYLDTLNLELGKKRFIIFKTSDFLSEDFSNMDRIKLKESVFKSGNTLCFDKTLPKYGIIEDIVFLPSDSIINGEESVRILKNYMYLNLSKPNLVKRNKSRLNN